MLLPLLLACASPPSSPRPPLPPDVVVVTWDTVRADHVSCTREGAPCAPLFSELSRDGVVFSQARSTTPETLPSHASLMTGLYPASHGARANGTFALGEDQTTLAERFSRAGYATGGFVSAPVLHRSTGMAQGFSAYNDQAGPPPLPYRSGRETTDAALQWLATVPAETPVFVWLHLFDAHRPLVPTLKQLEAADGDRYLAQVREVDAQTRRFVDGMAAAKRLERSLVVIAADHGEDLGDHGEETHSIFAYDSTVHIPMLWWWGAHVALPAARGHTVSDAVSLVDVAPTLESLLQLDGARTDGLSLAPSLQRQALPARTLLVESVTPAAALLTAPVFGYIDAQDQSWFSGPHPERYDLTLDPGQQNNLYTPSDAPRLDALAADRQWPPETEGTVAPETRAQLEALGYLGRGDASGRPASEDAARDRMATLRFAMTPFNSATQLLAAYDQTRATDGPSPHLLSAAVAGLDGMGARQAAEELLSGAPERREELAERRRKRSDQEALLARIDGFLATAGEGPGAADAWYDRGVTLRALERTEDARRALETALSLRPTDLEARKELARTLHSLGDAEAGIQVLDTAATPLPCDRGRLSSFTPNDARTLDLLLACAASGAALSHRDMRILATLQYGND